MTTSKVETETGIARPSARFEHLYAIIRVDAFHGPETPEEQKISVKKVVRDVAEAEQEVDRLNRLQKASGVRYFWQLTRLERFADDRPFPDSVGRLGRLERMDALVPPEAAAIEQTKFLESIKIPQPIWADPPIGLGFPQIRFFEVIANPSDIHVITWKGMTATIYARRSKSHADIVCLRDNHASIAFRVFPDLCDTPLPDLLPQEIIQKLADRFGFTLIIGAERGKFFLEKECPGPTIIVPAGPIIIDSPPGKPLVGTLMYKHEPPVLNVALAFAIDLDAYGKWLSSH
jgi:hypothetical protein